MTDATPCNTWEIYGNIAIQSKTFVHTCSATKIRKISSVSVFCQQESVASPFGLVQVSLGESLAGESKGHLLGNSQGHKCSVRTLWPNELQTSASVHRNTPLSHGLTLPQPLQQHLFRNLCAVIPRETGSIKACNYIFEPIDTYSIYYKYIYIYIYILYICDIWYIYSVWMYLASKWLASSVSQRCRASKETAGLVRVANAPGSLRAQPLQARVKGVLGKKPRTL